MRNVSSTISVLAISFVIAAAANAATFNVTTTNDTLDANPGDGICADANAGCSLRAAISEANALEGADTITMSMGTYTQTLVAPNDDSNAGGDWDITSAITINGTGEASCIFQAADFSGMAFERVLDVRPGGELRFSRATVRHGRFSGTTSAATRGAGIENLGVLSLDNVTVRDNQITSNGDAFGAGIYNAGTAMTLISTTVTANTLQAGGSSFGGGIASTSQTNITITNGFIGNSASANGGSVFGAGLYLEGRFTVTMSGTAVAHNSSSGTSGNNGSGISAISNAGAASFNATGCNFRNNSASGSANGQGVGLYFLTTGAGANTLVATVDGVLVKENIGTSSGVGIGAAVNGGDLTVNIINSSITDNIGGVVGGGIFVTDAGPASAGRATFNLTNTTISHNVANGTAGGLMLQGDRTSANLSHVTVAANSADSCGGICTAAGTINIKNSVVGDNAGGTVPDIGGSIVSGDYNHFESIAGATISGTTTNNAIGDALLGPRIEHVGGGAVHLPAINSPLLNTIPIGINGCGTSVTNDQRGVPRGPNGGCDKGAVERSVSANIAGKVTTFEGMGIRNAFVTLTGGDLSAPRTARTSSMGWYVFPDIPGERGYTVRVISKRFEITPEFRSVYLTRDVSDLNFTAAGSNRAK